MFSNLRLILGACATLVVFGVGAYLGYHFGTRKVAGLEAQIESFKTAGSEADAKLKQTQEQIARTLKDKEAEYAKQTEQLKIEAEHRATELAAAPTGANDRIRSLQGQVASVGASIDAKRSQLANEMSTASAAERKKLQDQIDALDREKKALMAKVLSNEYLAVAVPEEVIRPLAGRNALELKLSLAVSVPEDRRLSARN